MKPQFRFTLDGVKSIGDPIGWKDIELILSRHEEYFSVIEEINIPLEFYGENANVDGGYEYIKQKRAAGVDTIVVLGIEVSWDRGDTFDDLWEGVLDFTTLKEIEHLKRFQCTLMRNDKWSKFINRRAVKVNIRDGQTLDGANASSYVATSNTLNLPSQKITKTFRSEHYDILDDNYEVIQYVTTSTDKYASIDLPNIVTDELENKNTPGNVVNDIIPVQALFSIKENGSYVISISITLSSNDGASGGIIPNPRPEIRLRVNNGSEELLPHVILGTTGVDERITFTYNQTKQLITTDQIFLWYENDNATGDLSIVYQGHLGTDNFINIVAATTYVDTQVGGFFIHDVGRSIIGHTVGNEYFYSEYFGGGGTDVIVYNQEGCGAYYRLFGGLNLRGKSITDKPFTMSFDELWAGINPIFNLGLGYEIVSVNQGLGGFTGEVIRVEPKSHFFDDSEDSVQLDYVNNIEISYDSDFLLTSVEIGYQKWNDESSSGNDDPQTKHNYATRFKTIGRKDVKDMKLLSSLVAASLVIEQGRRLGLDVEKDWDFDEEKFIVQTTSSLSPQEVKLYSNEVITNLQNSETRYNVRLTPASNFNRWKDFLYIAFQDYIGDIFRFIDGQGNTTMTFNHPGAVGCDAEAGTNVEENEDKVITDDFLFLPIIYKFTHPLTWEQYKDLRDEKHNSFLITYISNEGLLVIVRLFIRHIRYRINQSTADFECHFKEFVEPEYNLQAAYNENVSGAPEWSFDFINLFSGALEGGSDFNQPVVSGNTTILTEVYKFVPDSVTAGNGYVRFIKNGLTVNQHNFTTGQTISASSPITYTFTGLNGADTLRIEISEG